MEHQFRNILLLCTTVLCLTPPREARAQAAQICIPAPIALPGFANPPEPPDWEPNSAPVCSAGPCTDSLDPRWAAAPLYPLQSGLTHVAFRVLAADPGNLYLQVRCMLGGSGTRTCSLGSDRLFLALGSDRPVILEVALPASSCGINLPCPIPLTQFIEYKALGLGFTALPTEPSSGSQVVIAKAHVWEKDNGWVASFHLQPRAPLTQLAMGARLVSGPNAASYRWPPCAGCPPCTNGTCVGGLIRNETSSWARVLDPCDGALVVDIASSNIGTRPTAGGPLGTSIDYRSGATNIFVARPEMGSNSWLLPDLVLGNFRVADWGTTVGAQGPWSTVTTGRSRIKTGELEQTCVRGSCPLPLGTLADQCMLVELSAGAAYPGVGPLLFSSAAAFRSSDFVEASTVQRRARVDLRGLERSFGLPAEPEVIFRVQTRNLPPRQPQPFVLPLAEMDAVRDEVDRGATPFLPPEYAQPESGSGVYRVDPLEERLASVWPSLVIHPFFNTGEIVEVDGDPRALFEPMLPFGLYVRHEGPLLGFEFSLTDSFGTNLLDEPLRTFEESSAVVNLTVTAIEPELLPPPFDPILFDPQLSGAGTLRPPPAVSCSLSPTYRGIEALYAWAACVLILGSMSWRRQGHGSMRKTSPWHRGRTPRAFERFNPRRCDAAEPW